jgi:hypothetical protein
MAARTTCPVSPRSAPVILISGAGVSLCDQLTNEASLIKIEVCWKKEKLRDIKRLPGQRYLAFSKAMSF